MLFCLSVFHIFFLSLKSLNQAVFSFLSSVVCCTYWFAHLNFLLYQFVPLFFDNWCVEFSNQYFGADIGDLTVFSNINQFFLKVFRCSRTKLFCPEEISSGVVFLFLSGKNYLLKCFTNISDSFSSDRLRRSNLVFLSLALVPKAYTNFMVYFFRVPIYFCFCVFCKCCISLLFFLFVFYLKLCRSFR